MEIETTSFRQAGNRTGRPRKTGLVGPLMSMVAVSVLAASSVAEAKKARDHRASKDKPTASVVEDQDTILAKNHYKLGFVYFEQKKYEEALKYFRQANEIKPTALMHYNIGQCLFFLGQYQEAKKEFRSYLDATMSSPENILVRTAIIQRVSEIDEILEKQTLPQTPHPVPIIPNEEPGTVAPAPPAKAAEQKQPEIKPQPSHEGRRVKIGPLVIGFAGGAYHLNGGTFGWEAGVRAGLAVEFERSGIELAIGFHETYGQFLARAGADRSIEDTVTNRCHMGFIGVEKMARKGPVDVGVGASATLGQCGFESTERVKGHSGIAGGAEGVVSVTRTLINRDAVRWNIGGVLAAGAKISEADIELGANVTLRTSLFF